LYIANLLRIFNTARLRAQQFAHWINIFGRARNLATPATYAGET